MKYRNYPFFQKSLVLIAVISLLAMMVAPAFAVETLYSENTLNDGGTWSTWANNNCSVGFTLAGNDQYLSRVQASLGNLTNEVFGLFVCDVYVSATTGAQNYPSGVPLETSSNSVGVSDLTGQTWETWTFSDTTFLNSSFYYCFAVRSPLGATGTIAWYESSSGYSWYNDTGGNPPLAGWTLTTDGKNYRVYTESTVSGGGTPYLYTEGAMDELIGSLMTFMVPLLVMLLPAFLLCFISRRVDKWLILLGLAIGAGLGYYFGLVPLWLVFLVTIGLIGMAYQSVRGGGN